ncbi:MAG: MBL fold metallo-hydrolase [Acidobacteria bacterium]|nr:MBL fold metallo-hydrolase [Acidobacteriota bacterium]
MLVSREHGHVRYFSIARSYASRSILTSGVYFVDGMLLDAGPANAHVEFAAIIGGVDADQLVLTHHHEDHIGNAAFAAKHLGRPPRAHGLTLPLVRKPQPLPLYRRITWGSPAPFEAEALSETVHTPKHVFQVIHTPGHAPDHVALYEPEQRWLFAGDLFIAPRLRLLRDDEDLTKLMGSLRALMKLPDCTLFCQHSGIHESHQRSLGGKLDSLLGMQQEAVVMHDEGLTVNEIVRRLKIGKPGTKFVSRGELSARNLVAELLRDAGIGDGNG